MMPYLKPTVDKKMRPVSKKAVVPIPAAPKTKDDERKTHTGKGMAPGGDGRFAKLEDALEAKGKSPDAAAAIAANAGRKKYGKAQFQAMAAKARKRKQ